MSHTRKTPYQRGEAADLIGPEFEDDFDLEGIEQEWIERGIIEVDYRDGNLYWADVDDDDPEALKARERELWDVVQRHDITVDPRERRDVAAMRSLRDEGLDVRGRYAGAAFAELGGTLLVFDRGLEPGFAWVEPAPDWLPGSMVAGRREKALITSAEGHARLAIHAAGFDPRAEPRPEIVLVRDRGDHLDVWHSTAEDPYSVMGCVRSFPTATRVEADDLPVKKPDDVTAANVIYEAYERVQEVLERLRPVAGSAILPEDAWAMGAEIEVALEELGNAAEALGRVERLAPADDKRKGPERGARR